MRSSEEVPFSTPLFYSFKFPNGVHIESVKEPLLLVAKAIPATTAATSRLAGQQLLISPSHLRRLPRVDQRLANRKLQMLRVLVVQASQSMSKTNCFLYEYSKHVNPRFFCRSVSMVYSIRR